MYFIKSALEKLKNSNNYRTLKIIQSAQQPRVMVEGIEYLMLASSSYLGLNTHPKLIQAASSAAEEYGVGSGGSRLITGTLTLHESLEYALTRFLRTEDTILFNSGYDANIGAISSILTKGDIILSDELNHASIIDGCHLSKAEVVIYKHNDMIDLEEKLKKCKKNLKSSSKLFIITDTIFSMDGDLAKLNEISELAAEHNAYLMVDEAHAVGVFGDHGRGAAEFFKIEDKINIRMGALSKAIGTAGGYISGSEDLIDYLRNRARSFIYTTSLPPPVLASSLAGLEVIRSDPELRDKLWENINKFKTELIDYGYNTMSSASQIIPIFIGEADETMEFSDYLYNSRIFALGIRPPTVQPGKCRIRTTMMANHSELDIKYVLRVFKKIKEKRLFGL